jgi:NiFe hydrogenase small subunit HydA
MNLKYYTGGKAIGEAVREAGMTRRRFLELCAATAAAMGLGPEAARALASGLEEARRPSVVYLHNAECTGCTEALLRLKEPSFAELILDVISLDYSESLTMAAGHAAEEALDRAISDPGGYICVIEGAIPTGHPGYGFIAGRSMMEICTRVATGAKAVIAHGSCASFGGIQAAAPNPSGAKGAGDALSGVVRRVVNIPGCPPNPANFVGVVAHYLAHGEMPDLDRFNRPKMFFGRTVHDQCERKEHFMRGEFAPSFDSREAGQGWCLHKLGCKGPYTYNNCPTALFNQRSWPVRSGHPCIGCSEPDFWDTLSPFYEEI